MTRYKIWPGMCKTEMEKEKGDCNGTIVAITTLHASKSRKDPPPPLLKGGSKSAVEHC